MNKVVIKVRIDHNLIKDVTKQCSRRGTWAALDYLAARSKEQVPLDKGPLKNSCYVDVEPDGSAGTVSYDTPYAVVQHETLWYQHQRGRKAKYLEDPCNDPKITAQMALLMKQEFERQM